MAKTTRKTEPTTGEKKPATRRAKAAPAAGAEKPAARRATKAAPAATPAHPAMIAEPTHDEIALRAWSIYERRGRSHGDANRDWLQAIDELVRERGLKP
jgi:hypothetical protein